jgi:CRP-like cAMP-binding protein
MNPRNRHVPPQSRPLSVLDRLTSRELKALLARCVERQVAAGTPLFAQGSPHTATFIVKRGLVRTYYASPRGKEVTVGFWTDGDMVGGPDFFEESMHVWSGEAAEDSAVWAIKGRDLRELSMRVPAIAECVIAALSFKLNWVSRLLQNMGTQSVRHRLAHLLVSLSDMYGVAGDEGIRIRYPFTQEDLANMICATRQWVNMTFRRLQQEGIVRVVKRRLVILDIEGLCAIARENPEGGTGE